MYNTNNRQKRLNFTTKKLAAIIYSKDLDRSRKYMCDSSKKFFKTTMTSDLDYIRNSHVNLVQSSTIVIKNLLLL